MTRLSRRAVLFAAPALLVVPRAVAALAVTPGATEGPFYPIEVPDDHDNDLVRVESAVREAGGEVLRLRGTVLDTAARPVSGLTVEIWQCDANGIYRHPRDRRFARRDADFQGFGRAATDGAGRFAFRTILPVPYPGRTPHIHVRVVEGGRERLVTQLYRAGYPGNPGDPLFRRMTEGEQERVSMAVRAHSSGRTPAQWESEVRLVVPPPR